MGPIDIALFAGPNALGSFKLLHYCVTDHMGHFGTFSPRHLHRFEKNNHGPILCVKHSVSQGDGPRAGFADGVCTPQCHSGPSLKSVLPGMNDG